MKNAGVKNAAWALAVGAALGAGCSSPPVGFDTDYPGGLIPAITRAARERDRDSIPDLIELLDNADPAVRFASIHALERITGQTLGYNHAAPEDERRERVAAWVQWYQEQSDPPGAAPEPVASR